MTTPPLPWWARGTTQPVLDADAPRRHHRTRRTACTLTATALAVAAATGILLTGANTPATQAVPGGGIAHRQTLQALIGGCGPTYTFTVDTAEAQRLAPAQDGTVPTQRYRTIVPFFGPYLPPAGNPPRRFYSPDDADTPTVEATVGYLHAGHMVAWYTKDADPKDVNALRALAADPTLDLIVIPWDSTGHGLLPVNRKIAYATWASSQTCHRLNAAAVGQFRTAHPATDAPGHKP